MIRRCHNIPLAACFCACLLLIDLAAAAELDATSSSTVIQFVESHCLRCHGAETQEGDLRFDDLVADTIVRRSKAHKNATDDERASRWHGIFAKVASREMPPEDEVQPSDADRSQFLARIELQHGLPPASKADSHWSFQPLTPPQIPTIESGDQTQPIDNPIDLFVLRRLQSKKLLMSNPADRATLLRRITLDLTGLPPTLAEQDAFAVDSAPTDVAVERVVSRLLDSPRYGERWAQHWLDVIRWAETVGFETNLQRPNAWHYRDWVIDALNDDMPYDRFLFEQLAGDTVGSDAALGFLVAGPANLPGQIGRDEEAMRQARQDELDEVIRTVSQAMFGLTIGCARCHDHKFDPISQQDYYSMQAIFAGLSYGNRRLRGEENDRWSAELPAARAELSRLEKQLVEFESAHDLRPAVESVTFERFAPILADAVRMEIYATNGGAASLYELEVFTTSGEPKAATAARNVALASNGSIPNASSFALANQTRHYDNLIDGSVDPRQAFPWVASQPGPAWVEVTLPSPTEIDHIVWHMGSSLPLSYDVKVRNARSGEWTIVAHTRDRMLNRSDQRPTSDIEIERISDNEKLALIELLAATRKQSAKVARLAAGPQTYAASFVDSPTETWLLRRGDPMQQDRIVPPVVPVVLREKLREPDHASHFEDEPSRRLALATHLSRPDHPLTARVIVNRIWQHHFGIGLVETPSDFGQMGAAPSHPELLDWLAVEFVKNAWSLKWLHRQIVLSRTYQQDSRPQSIPLAIDADSRLLWRFPPRRLEAEAMRDSVLATSGKLNLMMHGRGFDFFNQRGGLSDYIAKETFGESGWRRMIYAHKIRMQAIDVFGAFDCPDAGQMTPRRNASITPIQALGLFNSPFLNRQAGFFAERVAQETRADGVKKNSVDETAELATQVDRAFRIAVARPPTSVESDAMLKLAESYGLKQVCRVLLNSSEFVFIR